MSGPRDFHPDDLVAIAELMATPEGRQYLAVLPWNPEMRPMLEQTGIEKWVDLSIQAAHALNDTREGREWNLATFSTEHPAGKEASALIDRDWHQAVAHEQRTLGWSPKMDKTFMLMEKAYQSGDKDIGSALVEHVQQFGAPTPTRRRLAVLSPEEQAERLQHWHAEAAHRGLSFQQHIQSLDEAGAKAINSELSPSLLSEESAAATLKQLGREKIKGRSYGESLGANVRTEAEGQGSGARLMPFDPKLTPEQKRDEFLKTVPRETLAKLREQGVDPRAFADKTFDAARVATVHDEVQARLARRDSRLPPAPREQFNEGKDRRADILRAFDAHGATPEQFIEQHRKPIYNERRLHVAAAVNDATGGTPESFEREYRVPDHVIDDAQIDAQPKEEDEDNRRADIERAYQQAEGR